LRLRKDKPSPLQSSCHGGVLVAKFGSRPSADALSRFAEHFTPGVHSVRGARRCLKHNKPVMFPGTEEWGLLLDRHECLRYRSINHDLTVRFEGPIIPSPRSVALSVCKTFAVNGSQNTTRAMITYPLASKERSRAAPHRVLQTSNSSAAGADNRRQGTRADTRRHH